jgi:SRSO17 transposase
MAMSSSVKNKVIYIADRGYESYNLMAHINHLNRFYVIRVKDNHNGGFARIFPKPDNDEYDVEYTRKFTRKMSKEYTKRKGEYVIIRHSYDMDFFTPEHDMYKMTFRIIRFKLPNGQYESIATNLPSNEFTWQEIKEIYNLRWGIESSFRSLKYSVELNQFHGKREEYVLQETFARLIMFNFCQSIVEPITYNSTNKKHIYKPDFKNAVHILKMYLRKTKTPPGLVDELIKKDPIPIRPERSYPRKKYAKAPPFARY